MNLVNFLISQIATMKDRRGRRQRDTLASLRLSLVKLIFEASYLETKKSYQKVVNYKNEVLVLIYKMK